MNSIMQSDTNKCFLCGRNGYSDRLEAHHVFGASNRKHSDEDGLIVFLCGDRCHRNGKRSAHRCRETADYLKAEAQAVWEMHYGSTEDFMKRYGKNYK